MQDLKTLSTAVYLDLEWNIARRRPNAAATLEIIEIGLVELDPITLSIVREASFLVRPRQVDISLLTTSITGITRDDLIHARPLRDVISAIVRDWPRKATCFFWGNDGDILTRACCEHRVGAPFRHFVDLCLQMQNVLLLPEHVSVRNALEALSLPFDGGEHVAVVDARNTARIHAEIVRRIRAGEPPVSEQNAATTEGGPTWFGRLLQSSLAEHKEQRQDGASQEENGIVGNSDNARLEGCATDRQQGEI